MLENIEKKTKINYILESVLFIKILKIIIFFWDTFFKVFFSINKLLKKN